MALYFDDEIKKHLILLINAPSQVLVDFCKLALDYIRNGPNEKRYTIAAQKLETTVEEIDNAVTALVKLLIDGCKYSLSVEGFVESMLGIGFNQEAAGVLGRLYSARGAELSSTLGELSSHTAHRSYRDLHWRLQAQVASRSVAEQLRPSVVVSLELGPPSSAPCPPLQLSLPDLVHVAGQLEGALRDSRTFHIRRMQRVLEQ